MPLRAKREPDDAGIYGKAWRSRMPNRDPAHSACLAIWVLDRPGAHAFWSSWGASVVHLRPISGVEPAKLNYPEAEFEIQVIALNPKPEIDPDVGPIPFLMPPDLVYQFHGVSDRDAVRLLNLFVHSVVEHGVSPDSDWRERNEKMLAATLDHLRQGKHPEN